MDCCILNRLVASVPLISKRHLDRVACDLLHRPSQLLHLRSILRIGRGGIRPRDGPGCRWPDAPCSGAEYDLFCRFRGLAKGRTMISVSHRFTTLSLADPILVMERGCIVERGT
jgi:hypothetical protein